MRKVGAVNILARLNSAYHLVSSDHAMMFHDVKAHLVSMFVSIDLFFTHMSFVLYCYILDQFCFTMHAYMDKKNLLCEPSERQRLLEEVPQVIPDTKDSKDTGSQVPAEDKSIQNNAVDFQGDNPTNPYDCCIF